MVLEKVRPKMAVSDFLVEQPNQCPPNLMEQAASRAPVRLAVAAAGAPLPMEAVHSSVAAGLATPVLFGDPARISAEAERIGFDLAQAEVVPCSSDEEAAQNAAKACGDGTTDALMKGGLHTDVFMKAAVSRDNGLRIGQRFVHLFALYPSGGGDPLLISDAAVNVAPNDEALRAALSNMIAVAQRLGTERPKIALLSATEHPIPSVPSSETMNGLQKWAEAQEFIADVRGPLALDLILSTEAARIKGVINDTVAGQANGIIVPDLVSGNVLFKALVYLSGAVAAGVIAGAKVPILLTSRADPPAARLASIALASILRS